jgi:hypothetical protein
MDIWVWVVLGILGWCVVAIVIGLVVGRAVKLRDQESDEQ